MEWRSKTEEYTAMVGAGVGVVLMAVMMYVFYLISTTCGYPLIDGKCQNVQVEASVDKQDEVR